MSLTAGLAMTWHDLLFAHWPVPVEALRGVVPSSLEIETFDGTAWLGVVPFRMTRVRPFGLWLPRGEFAFAEVNLRTYVRAAGHRGVWFLSLDGGHVAAAAAARWVFGIEYRHATVRCSEDRDGISFSSSRRRPQAAMFEARYRPIGAPRVPATGSLEDFLTDRLSLFGIGRGGTLTRSRVEHEPWQVSPAEVSIEANTLASSIGIDLPRVPALAQFARRLEVIGRRPRPLDARGAGI